MAGKNIGDLLNTRGITWGWFEGGFDLTITNPNGTTGCKRETDPTASGGTGKGTTDYIPHHQPFQTSILRFIEDNWLSGQRVQPGGSFDTIAGTIANMFNFDDDDEEEDALARRLILDPETGAVVTPPSLNGNDDDHGGE
jgi:hypothetical protein